MCAPRTGRLHAQLRPEDDNMKRGETKFDLNTGLRDVVTSAQEGWAKGAGERDSATDVPVGLGPCRLPARWAASLGIPGNI